MNEWSPREEILEKEGNSEEWDYELDSRYKCDILRNTHLGFWCGYVSVPKGHPCFGLYYDAIEDRYPDLNIHGGITYAEPAEAPTDFIFGEDREDTEKRLSEASEKAQYWQIGFDCGHYDDMTLNSPFDSEGFLTQFVGDKMNDYPKKHGGTYKTKEWVKNEVNNLARQLKEIESKK